MGQDYIPSRFKGASDPREAHFGAVSHSGNRTALLERLHVFYTQPDPHSDHTNRHDRFQRPRAGGGARAGAQGAAKAEDPEGPTAEARLPQGASVHASLYDRSRVAPHRCGYCEAALACTLLIVIQNDDTCVVRVYALVEPRSSMRARSLTWLKLYPYVEAVSFFPRARRCSRC
jgi:hypothetical protein